MNSRIAALIFILATARVCYSDICLDILNHPELEYSLEEVNRCHACGWHLIKDDGRSSPFVSSDLSAGAGFSRLHNATSAWCATNRRDYLEITLPRPAKVGGFKISGYGGKWVRTLRVSYGGDDGKMHFAKSLDGSEIFRANENSNLITLRKFAIPIHARIVRILPLSKHRRSCLRVDLFSCEDISNTNIPAADYLVPPLPFCTINTRTDCGEMKCAKYKKIWTGCQICECDMSTGGVFEGDIYLDEPTINIAQVRLGNSDQPDGTYSAGARHAARFQDYKSRGKYLVYYRIAASFSSTEMRNMRAAISHIAQKSCIQLTPYPSGRNIPYYLKFYRGQGCSSPVGKARSGGNSVSIGYGCGQVGIIVHEIMHSLGFWHEQSRPDRDNYVTINWRNIQRGTEYNFQKQGTSTINSFNSPYDYRSLMHYGDTAFSVNRGKTIYPKQRGVTLGQRSGLSTEDAKQLNAMYECDKLTGGTITTRRPPSTTKPGGSCVDEHRSCQRWSEGDECSKNPGYMLVKCKKSCKVCNGGGGTRSTTATTTTKSSGTCTDNHVSCGPWAKYGECKKNPGYMLVNCKKSCKECTGGGSCADDSKRCGSWAADGWCSRSPTYMSKSCKKSCKVCT